MIAQGDVNLLNNKIMNMSSNMLFLSMLIEKPQIPAKSRSSFTEMIDYIDYYYSLELRYKEAGYSKIWGKVQEGATEDLEYYINLSKSWNEATALFKKYAKRKTIDISKMPASNFIFSLPGGHYTVPTNNGGEATHFGGSMLQLSNTELEKAVTRYNAVGQEYFLFTESPDIFFDALRKLLECISEEDMDFELIENYLTTAKLWFDKNIVQNSIKSDLTLISGKEKNLELLSTGNALWNQMEALFYEEQSAEDIANYEDSIENLIYQVEVYIGYR